MCAHLVVRSEALEVLQLRKRISQVVCQMLGFIQTAFNKTGEFFFHQTGSVYRFATERCAGRRVSNTVDYRSQLKSLLKPPES